MIISDSLKKCISVYRSLCTSTYRDYSRTTYRDYGKFPCLLQPGRGGDCQTAVVAIAGCG